MSKGRSALAAPLSAGLVMVVIAGIAPKAAGELRLWAPVIGAVAGSGVVAIQRESWRRPWAADFRAVQGAITVDGLGKLLSGLVGTTPNTATTVGASVTELTGEGDAGRNGQEVVAEEHGERCRRVTPDSRAPCETSRQGVGWDGGQGRHIGHSQRDCIACSTNVLVAHLCPHCSFIFNWLELLHAILAPHSRPFTRNAVPRLPGGILGGQGKCEQVDEIESDAPPPSSTRCGVQATIAIVFSDSIQTFEPRELATRGQRLTIRRVRGECIRHPRRAARLHPSGVAGGRYADEAFATLGFAHRTSTTGRRTGPERRWATRSRSTRRRRPVAAGATRTGLC